MTHPAKSHARGRAAAAALTALVVVAGVLSAGVLSAGAAAGANAAAPALGIPGTQAAPAVHLNPAQTAPLAGAKKKPITAPAPKITGTAKAGKTLTVKPGAAKPSGAKKSIQWYRAGVAVKGATKTTYALKNVDAGKKITVKVTYKKSGYTTKKVSKKTGTIAMRTPWKAEGVPTFYKGNPKIAAGVYFAPSPTPTCQYYRYVYQGSNLVGKGGNGVAHHVIELDGTEEGFGSVDCGNWYKADGTGPKATKITKSGTYQVGVDIAVGYYVVSGAGPDCYVHYWQDATRDAGSEISYVHPNSGVLFAVRKTDKFIYIEGCGTATKAPNIG